MSWGRRVRWGAKGREEGGGKEAGREEFITRSASCDEDDFALDGEGAYGAVLRHFIL